MGRGEDGTFLASAIPAFLRHTRRVQVIENGELVAITPDGATFLQADGTPVDRAVEEVDWDEETAEKGGFESFMLKEIHEQADAVAETIADRTVREDGVDLADEASFDESLLLDVRRIVVVACGTSYHAGLIGRYAIEEWARVPVEMDVASEYRYRNPVVGPGDLVIGITQSGETADTLAAMRIARERRGARAGDHEHHGVAGDPRRRRRPVHPRRARGRRRGHEDLRLPGRRHVPPRPAPGRAARHAARRAPDASSCATSSASRTPSSELLVGVDAEVEAIADAHWEAGFFLYLGRHVGLPVALEGALKLKEISYISTDAYAAGEMKHGPIALLDERTPVVIVATRSPVHDKVISNMQEVRARGAHVIAVGTEGDDELAAHAEQVLHVPATDWMLQPLLAVIPLQLLAYRIARRRGLNVDQPRNLAKTVTVE